MPMAEYSDVYWFPDGSLARNIPARIFPEHSNTFAALFADADGATPLPNPLNTDNDGRLHFWVQAGIYWISIDQESIRVPIGVGEEGITPEQLEAAVVAHNADTTEVHGIPDTAALATDDDLAAHNTDTTDVHGIADTGELETQAGAQDKADAAQAEAEANASADAAGKVAEARGELEEDIAAGDRAGADALAAHAADTTNIHGIPDTATIPTNAQFQQVEAELAAHAADTTDVHGIADTGQLATDADVDAVSGSLADHVADTTGVHGIADTGELLTSADLEQYATDADLATHAADTTAVHGIPDTSQLLTQADLSQFATDADVTQVQTNLDNHAADTTAVHGIADTSQIATQADLDGLASETELQAHASATTEVHGIPDTSQLLTQADLSQFATDADVTQVQTNLDTHAADTTAVHGIADTSQLLTQADVSQFATDADVTQVQANLDAHATDMTNVHGIPDTGQLATQADLAGYATDAELTAHAADATAVHGIADTAALETASGAQTKANAARDAAIADAATKYLNRTTGGTVNGDVTLTGMTTHNGLLQFLNNSATAVNVAAQVPGDLYDRFRINTNGGMEWGTGAVPRDTVVERDGVGILAGRDSMFRTYRAAVGGNAFSARLTGDTASRWFVNADGAMYWGPGGSTGADAGLYRSGVYQLTTNAALQTTRFGATDPVRDVRVSTDTQPRFYQLVTGQMYWGGGASSLDTTLYRDQPGSLVTDTNLTVNGSLIVGGVRQKLFARRTTDLTRTNNATRSNDTQMTVTLAANAVYEVHGMIIWGNSSGGDIQIAFAAPTGATGWWGGIAPPVAAAADPTNVRVPANTVTQFRTYGWFDNGSPNATQITACVVTGASGGTYAVTWAQNTADATGTTVYANSFISAERVA